MKVLQINAVYGIGSTGRIVEELDIALQKANIDSIIATTQTTKENANIYIVGTTFGESIMEKDMAIQKIKLKIGTVYQKEPNGVYYFRYQVNGARKGAVPDYHSNSIFSGYL